MFCIKKKKKKNVWLFWKFKSIKNCKSNKMKENTISSIEELQEIELGEPCQLFKSNERNRKLCTKIDYFLCGHKLSWATAHFISLHLLK